MHFLFLSKWARTAYLRSAFDWFWRFKKKCRLFGLQSRGPNYSMVLGNRSIIFSIITSKTYPVYNRNFENPSRRFCPIARNERNATNFDSQRSKPRTVAKVAHLLQPARLAKLPKQIDVKVKAANRDNLGQWRFWIYVIIYW